MKILIQNGRVMDPATGRDERADVAVAAGRIIAIGNVAPDFHPNRTIDATGCVVAPGLIDLSVRLREPGQEHAGMLESEMAAAVAGGLAGNGIALGIGALGEAGEGVIFGEDADHRRVIKILDAGNFRHCRHVGRLRRAFERVDRQQPDASAGAGRGWSGL